MQIRCIELAHPLSIRARINIRIRKNANLEKINENVEHSLFNNASERNNIDNIILTLLRLIMY